MTTEKKFNFIYKTVNVKTNKFYIGMHSTDDLNDGYLGSGKILQRSIQKYGKENHILEIVEYCNTRKILKQRERDIVTSDLLKNEQCMNLKCGGEGGWGPHTIESRRKISESRKGKHFSHTEATKQKMRETFSKKTEEEKNKLRTCTGDRVPSTAGTRWYNDGTKSILIKSGEIIPDGLTKGRLPHTKLLPVSLKVRTVHPQ